MREVERPNRRGLTVEGLEAWSASVTERERERGGGSGGLELVAITERPREKGGGTEMAKGEMLS